ncbi:chromosome 7 open reading frame 43 [Elysia marginata]|uniref:Chromosome 7 open reading frame 43 n=1 Tax=Elysia marginata TaxID=1093978 RepID=A0AAV4ECX3_9GAST|nr:chromosome 7 open reading frame 43 [Elysia marginata]
MQMMYNFTILACLFYVTYTIYNQLHDFMRMRLYYNLENLWKSIAEKGGTKEEKSRVDNIRNAVVCHDPDIPISSCPRGSCVCVPVGFQIHRPGLYEMSELMKVNLLYSFSDNPRRDQRTPPYSHGHHSSKQQQQQQQQQKEQHKQLHATSSSSSSVSATSDYGASASSSSSSPSLQSTDNPDRASLLAAEELWRGRSGSTNSLATPPPASVSAEEKRKTFASKSYSFGDLGPNASADSDQGDQPKQKPIKRSSVVGPSRPPPPKQLSKTERDLVRPTNFLKQPFYIHVRDPHTV